MKITEFNKIQFFCALICGKILSSIFCCNKKNIVL